MEDDFRSFFRRPTPGGTAAAGATTKKSNGPRIKFSYRLLSAAGATLLAFTLLGAALIASSGSPEPKRSQFGRAAPSDADHSENDSHTADLEGAPSLEDLGDGRFRGPHGTIVNLPPGWQISNGERPELWATLTPKGSTAPIPRIGIGDIRADGIDPADALDSVSYYLSEVLPEISSTEEPFRGGVLVRGKGVVEGMALEEVRWMFAREQGVLVVWGLFPPGYPAAVDLVVNTVEIPAG